MILSALNDYYQRLAGENRVPPPGFSSEKISFCLVFSHQGKPLQIVDLRDTAGKNPRAISYWVPYDKGRASNVHPYPLWDKTAYSLGVTAGEEKRLDDLHQAFKIRQMQVFSNSNDTEINAFLRFLDKWSPGLIEGISGYSEDVLDANFIFRFDGSRHYVHENEKGVQLWGDSLRKSSQDAVGQCLITGEEASLGTDHPKIRGVLNAQSSGASLVSFNKTAYESYGHKGQANASISKDAIFGYSTALNYLLRSDAENHQRLQIGDTTTVFWAESQDSECAEAAEVFFAMLNEPPSEEQESFKLASLLSDVAKGRPLAELDPALDASTRFFVLGLAPNAARLSVRFWYTDSLEHLAQHYAWHHQDLQLKPAPWKGLAPAMWRLLHATAPSRNGKSKAEDVPPQLAGELARAIFSGNRYPSSILSNLIMRMRNDGDISGIRVALCKAVLARKGRLSAYSNATTQEVPVSLDRHSTHPGYLLGRLFAELENAQRAALGGQINATIRDRYYGAASATPASIFPMLLRNVQNHLSNMRKKDKGGLAQTIEGEIASIIDGMGEKFPKSLHIEDQGRFAIGYYHQSQARFVKKEKATAPEATEGDK